MVDGNANRDCQSKGLVWYRIRKYVSCKYLVVQSTDCGILVSEGGFIPSCGPTFYNSN